MKNNIWFPIVTQMIGLVFVIIGIFLIVFEESLRITSYINGFDTNNSFNGTWEIAILLILFGYLIILISLISHTVYGKDFKNRLMSGIALIGFIVFTFLILLDWGILFAAGFAGGAISLKFILIIVSIYAVLHILIIASISLPLYKIGGKKIVLINMIVTPIVLVAFPMLDYCLRSYYNIGWPGYYFIFEYILYGLVFITPLTLILVACFFALRKTSPDFFKVFDCSDDPDTSKNTRRHHRRNRNGKRNYSTSREKKRIWS